MATGEIDIKRRDPLLGRVIAGRYRLTETLGSGGMGVVYVARQDGLERDVVIKVIRPDAAADPQAIARFENEARTAASVVHPHIVTVHDFGRDPDGLFYLVMERLIGRSLRDIIMPPRAPGDVHPGPGFAPERQALELPFAIDCVRQIALALAAAHAKGVSHRDLKPSNVFLVPAFVGHQYVVKVLDFGLAKRTRSSSRSDITKSGELIGTVGYGSPEQLTENKSDARSDLFSLGVLFYELLTAKHPFLADTEAVTLMNQVQLMPPAPSTIDGTIPPEIDDIVLRLLRKEPEARTASAEELIEALDDFTASRGAPASSTQLPADATRRIAQLRPKPATKKKRARWPMAVVTGVAAVALLVALVAAASPGADPPRVPQGASSNEVAARSLLPLPPRDELDEEGKRLVALGRALYHDPVLSGPNTISCATCHPMEQGGTTREPLTRLGSTGEPARWNTPTTWNATIIYRQTWRGDVETISQVIDRPLFNPAMMAAKNWKEVLSELQSSPRHIALFEAAGAPIDQATVGKALTLYMDQAAPRNAPFDRYLRGDVNALDPVARAGAERFESLGCAACHQGAGIGGNMLARFGVLAGTHPYEARGKCSDGQFCRSDEGCRQGIVLPEAAAKERCVKSDEIRPEDNGFVTNDPMRDPTYMFKVPSLRNVMRTAPYFHDGSARTIEEAVRTMGTLQLGVTLSDDDVKQLVAFLDSLSATLPDDEVRLANDATRGARLSSAGAGAP